MTSKTMSKRRFLRLASIDELVCEVDRLVAAQRAGHLVAAGNWTAAQIFDHLAKQIEFSYEGFPFRASAPVQAFCHVAKWVAWRPFVDWVFQPGRALPAYAEPLLPDPWADFDIATARLHAALARIERGERMTEPSPWEGALSHEQWLYCHLRHAELHLSFLDLAER